MCLCSFLLGHEQCCDHSMQPFLSCWLSEEMALRPGDVSTLSLAAQEPVTNWPRWPQSRYPSSQSEPCRAGWSSSWWEGKGWRSSGWEWGGRWQNCNASWRSLWCVSISPTTEDFIIAWPISIYTREGIEYALTQHSALLIFLWHSPLQPSPFVLSGESQLRSTWPSLSKKLWLLVGQPGVTYCTHVWPAPSRPRGAVSSPQPLNHDVTQVIHAHKSTIHTIRLPVMLEELQTHFKISTEMRNYRTPTQKWNDYHHPPVWYHSCLGTVPPEWSSSQFEPLCKQLLALHPVFEMWNLFGPTVNISQIRLISVPDISYDCTPPTFSAVLSTVFGGPSAVAHVPWSVERWVRCSESLKELHNSWVYAISEYKAPYLLWR